MFVVSIGVVLKGVYKGVKKLHVLLNKSMNVHESMNIKEPNKVKSQSLN